MEIDGAVSNLGADGPAIITVITLAPPAIQHTEIKPTIGWRFHTAGAAGFKWTQRIIQPEIDSLDQTPRNVGVVIFNEDNPIMKTGFAREFVNFLNERFATFVSRMRFTGEYELDRPSCVVEQSLEPLFIREQESAALIAGEASGEPDGEDLRIK